jgi:predicted PurR-regulated permease PerM
VIRPRQSQVVRTATVLVGVIAVLYFARDILIPLALAITLSLILWPAVAWLHKLHVPRAAGALLVILVFVSISGGVGYVIVNQIVQVVNELPGYRENINHKLQTLRAPNKGALGRAADNVKELGKELTPPWDATVTPPGRAAAGRKTTPSNPLPVQVIEPTPSELVYIRAVTEPFWAPLGKLGIVLVFTVFLLVEKEDLRNRVFRLAGLNRLNMMTQAMEDGTRRISRYLMLQFLVNAGFGILSGTGLYLIGVPYAALWGTVAALLRIVPYVGSIVAGLLPLLLSLAVFDGWRSPLWVFVLFVTLELITANLIEPWLYGAHTGMSALALLVTTVFWATLWGPLGLILSTPLTVCVVVLGRHIPHLSFLHILLGDQPVLAPDAHLYQRLLAMDDQEARLVADQYRKEKSLAQLYDTVMIPALTMAEQDRHKGALDAEREEFLFLTLREMIADMSVEPRSTESEGSAQNLQGRPTVPERVVCLPANDEADEIAGAMLVQLLEHAGCAAVSVPLGPSAMNMLGLIEPKVNDVFCISAIQPFAFSHARALSRELKAKFPGTKTVVGVWGFNGNIERALLRFQPSPPDKFVKSLAEAIEYLGVHSLAPSSEVLG